MIEIAFRRRFSEVVAGLRVATGEQGKTDRGWQDKARKVRAVGWGEEGSNFNHAPNIAKIQRTLPFSTTRYRTTTFDTL
jgi:hypothetical protein